MTRLALKPAVPAVEHERRAPVVIEIPRLPGSRVVTILAARSEAKSVFVVFAMAADAGCLGILERRGQMAFLAVDLGVCAEQRKPGQTMVEQRPLPRALVVAAVALLPFLPLVFVVLQMASDTRRGQLVAEQVPGMAAVTAHRDMLAAQRIPGLAIVVERRRLPHRFDVARRALLAVATLMRVVLTVARDANGGRFFLEQKTGVAPLAFGEPVFAFQPILRVAIVIERDSLPIAVGMATFAARTEALLVLVVLAMAGHALRRGALERRVGVARAARYIDVFAGERKAGLTVIKPRGFPVGLGMAVAAAAAETAAVLVVFLVTSNTVDGRVAELLSRQVAMAALDLRIRMRAAQQEIGLPMIECA